jgi:hypothetical protein
MTENETLKEYHVIKHVARYLMRKNWTIQKISVRKKNEREEIMKELNLDYGKFQKEGQDIVDIVATAWNRGRRIRIEAKGGTYKYGIYTALGQMVCTLDDTRYNWFGLAFPKEWKDRLQKLIEKSAILRQVMADAQKKHKGLFFYFVDKKGVVEKKTWRQLL